MTRWEYRMEMPTSDFNNLGAEGWELCAVLHNGMAVFRRPLRDAQSPRTIPLMFYASRCDAEGCDGWVSPKDDQWCCEVCGKSFGPAPAGAIVVGERTPAPKQEGAAEFDGWIGGTRVREVLD